MSLNKDTVRIILEYASEWKIRPEILALENTLKNFDNFDQIKNDALTLNPHGEKDVSMPNIYFDILSCNSADWALDLLLQDQNKILWKFSSYNENPRIIPYWEANLDKLDWDVLSGNCIAISLLSRFPERITNRIWANPASDAKKLIDTLKIPVYSNWLVTNSSSWAQEIRKELNLEPSIEGYSDLSQLDLGALDEEKWHQLNSHPGAISILLANPEKVKPIIFCNPSIYILFTMPGLEDVLMEI